MKERLKDLRAIDNKVEETCKNARYLEREDLSCQLFQTLRHRITHINRLKILHFTMAENLSKGLVDVTHLNKYTEDGTLQRSGRIT